MLLTYGTVICNTEDRYKEIAKILEDNGYEIAIITEMSGTIIKEESSEE